MIQERRQWRRSVVFIVNFEHVIAGWVNTFFTRVILPTYPYPPL